MEDFHIFLRSRRSIRRFKSQPIEGEKIRRMIETATFAPSAHNLQPWRFVVVTGCETKLRLAENISDKFRQDMQKDGIPNNEIEKRIKKNLRRAAEAPLIVILCRDTKVGKPQPDIKREQIETIMNLQSVALAGLQLLLAAHAEGLGGTWICWPLFANEETKKTLGTMDSWEPQGMLFLGYPDETPEVPAKLSYQEVTCFL